MDQKQKPLVWLKGKSVEYSDAIFFISKEEFIIGRAPQCDLVLAETTVSAEHAKIFKKDKQWHIMDLSSTNGTRLNKEKITEKRIRTKDIITIESLNFQFINQLDVERTIVAEAEESAELIKTLAKVAASPTNESPYSTNKELTPPKVTIKEQETSVPVHSNLFRSLLMALVFTLSLNIGIPFLVSIIQASKITGKGLSILFSTIIAGLPILHLPTHWIQFFNWNIFSVIVLICIPLGIIGGGFILQRSSPKSRKIAIISFSFGYLSLTQLLQLIVTNFNFNAWINLYNGSGLGINNSILNFLSALLIYFLIVSFFTYIGTIFSKS